MLNSFYLQDSSLEAGDQRLLNNRQEQDNAPGPAASTSDEPSVNMPENAGAAPGEPNDTVPEHEFEVIDESVPQRSQFQPVDDTGDTSALEPANEQESIPPQENLSEEGLRRRRNLAPPEPEVPLRIVPGPSSVSDAQSREHEAVEINLPLRHDSRQGEEQVRAEEPDLDEGPSTQMEHIDEPEQLNNDYQEVRPPLLTIPCDLQENIVRAMSNTQEGDRVCRELQRMLGVYPASGNEPDLNYLLHFWQMTTFNNSVEDLKRLAETIGSQQMQSVIINYRGAQGRRSIYYYILRPDSYPNYEFSSPNRYPIFVPILAAIIVILISLILK